ncbi:hypothetical protein JA1_000912 [Spathaspora sp. JA1]|nr:hypothetical protein JA1_000912 [Spathaspora sp. JA1]
MAVRLSSDDAAVTEAILSGLETPVRPILQAYASDDEADECSDHEIEEEEEDDEEEGVQVVTARVAEPYNTVTNNSIQSFHEYELTQSESLTFLYNLLYDDNSQLSKSDILIILNSLKIREEKLPFSFDSSNFSDIQGVRWPQGLKQKFNNDRRRVGKDNWFHNIPNSRENALKKLNIKGYQIKTEFFKFHRFFSKLKLHITHLQLRNLVCCGTNIGQGIYYPSSYFHDSHMQTISVNDGDQDYHSFFKINRIMPDKRASGKSHSMKVDCLIDSRNLVKNSNSRISTLACTNNYLASGTFEGSYILSDVSNPEEVRNIGEYHLSSNIDGITNQIIINEPDQELIVSSNDKSMRLIDLNKHKITQLYSLPFPLNCSALNPNNSNELFVTGDNINSYIVDKRIKFSYNNNLGFKSHDDFGFGCDWSSQNENLLLTGNQDSCVKLWDKRFNEKPLYSWSGTLGFSEARYGAPVRNCKFSHNGDYIAWAESLDHVGIIQVNDLLQTDSEIQSRIQSIDFLGKCCGLNFAPIEQDRGEQLIIGVIDCPLGGILSYKLESKDKSLDFDYYF